MGNRRSNRCFNTRPVILHTCNGNILTVNNEQRTSSVFRVEEVFDNCCKLRILKENRKEKEHHHRFVSTRKFITVNLNCIGALQCLDDVIVSNL